MPVRIERKMKPFKVLLWPRERGLGSLIKELRKDWDIWVGILCYFLCCTAY